MIFALIAGLAAGLGAGTGTNNDSSGATSDLRQEIFRRQSSGQHALRIGDGKAAVEDLCWAMSRALNSHEAAWHCGQARLLVRDPEGAVEALEIATDLDPDHLVSWVDLGDAYSAAGKTDRARAAYYRALELRKDYALAFDGLGRLAAALGDDAGASELFGKALEANPAEARVLLHRGSIALQRRQIDAALADLREAARLRPDEPEVQQGLARALLAAGLSDEALAAATRVRDSRPRDPYAVALVAEIMRRSGAFPEAIEAATQALALDPDYSAARVTLGGALGASGQIDRAIELLVAPNPKRLLPKEREELEAERQRWVARREQLRQIAAVPLDDHSPPSAWLDAADALIESGQIERGGELVARLATQELNDAATLRRAAQTLFRGGRMLAAESLLQRLVAGQSAIGADWSDLGLVLERSGDHDGSRKAYARALEFGPSSAAHAGLARLAWAAGDTQKVIEELRAFLGSNPDPTAAARAQQALARLAPPPPAAPATPAASAK